MTDNEKQRIAEWCGWTDIKHAVYDDYFLGTNSQGVRKPLPDYLNSRDACAEFEDVIEKGNKADWWDYMTALLSVMTRNQRSDWPIGLDGQTVDRIKVLDMLYIAWRSLRATPAQRVEAILWVIEEQS